VTSLDALAVARTWSTAGLVLHRGSERDVAAVLARSEPLLRSLTEGVVRWRVEWVGAGHRRAATRELAEKASTEGFVNDPVAADWEIAIEEKTVLAIPKGWDDRRFAYRVADVPASSHPTIAAAIARVGGARDDDVVWDPFVGSGLELVERARLGPYRSLLGTDTDPRALAAAKRNAASSHTERVTLTLADARAFTPKEPVTLVLTNPPMGRRVQSGGGLDALLTAALKNVSRALAGGGRGRLVWITPHPRSTNPVLEAAGLRRTRDLVVDLHGFAGNLQSWVR
jgi:predicted RNA methylase